MNKGSISNMLRRFGLIYFTDWLRYYIEKSKNKKSNREFRLKNPDVKLPSDYLMYESFNMNYDKYYNDGEVSARELVEHFRKHIDLKDKKILDWGCGPGRIIRHMPEIIGSGCEYFGTDYNKKSIAWCSENLTDITFNLNTLEAKLPYADNSIDVIYGISIFTHLSEQMHYDWYNELFRVLSSGGIMLLTSQGDNFKVKLTDTEIAQYERGDIVVRGKVKEGHRTYSAFHPAEFMRKMFSNIEVVEHIEPEQTSPAWIPQDIWIVKKG